MIIVWRVLLAHFTNDREILMKKQHALTALVILAFGGAACGPDVPTGPQAHPSSGAPLTDGGVMYGSGNSAGAAQTQAAADSSGVTTGRGGVMYGSGN